MADFDDLKNYIDKLPDDEKEKAISYVLNELVGPKLAKGETVEITRADGTIAGYILPPEAPSQEITNIMRERAKRITPGAGNSLDQLLGRMKADDEAGVSAYIKKSEGMSR